MMETYSGANKKTPVQRGDFLPMVRNIGTQFPIFLIYAG